jgi:hypothetical protein
LREPDVFVSTDKRVTGPHTRAVSWHSAFLLSHG